MSNDSCDCITREDLLASVHMGMHNFGHVSVEIVRT